MYLPSCLAIVLILSNVSWASLVPAPNHGCTLFVPQSVNRQREAKGSPLLISVDIKVRDVRDVPDSGGSYGADIR